MNLNEATFQLNVNSNTLRNWGTRFNKYLSEPAKIRNIPNRVFSEHDLRIFAYIQQLKGKGYTSAYISGKLDIMQADDWRGLPEVELKPTEYLSMVQKVEAAEDHIFEQDGTLKNLLTDFATLRVIVLIVLAIHLYRFINARSKLS